MVGGEGTAGTLDASLGSVFPDGLQGRSVLDCACGNGAALLQAREHGAGRCLGLDEREDLLREARSLATADGPGGTVRFEVGEVEGLRARGERRFDVTLFRDLFHRLPDPIATLSAAAELTQEVLLLETPIRAGAPDHFLVVDGDGSGNGTSSALAWLPTGPEVLSRMLRSVGFVETRVADASPKDGRGQIAILASKRAGLVAPVSKVTRGRHGWLFLSDDTNQVLRQHAGQLRFSRGDLERWRGVLESRARRLGELGISHHFLVVPNKESIYAEYLPAGLPSARERPVHQLVNHLAAAGSPVSIVYPEPEMRAAKQRWPLFPKGDTHWNGLGGYVAYRALAEAVAKDVPVQVVELEDLECVRWAEHGDLSEKLVPPEPAVKLMARVRNFRARLVYNNRVRNTGRILAFEREDLEGPTCMMFGDSFAWTLFTYLAESFPRFVFVHRPTLDYDVIERERPGLVLSELIERFLIAVPDDDNAPSTAELEESKRLRNQVMSDDEALSFARYFDPDFRSVHVHWSNDLDAVAASVDH